MDIFEFGDKNSKIVLIQAVDGHELNSMERELTYIEEKADKGFSLLAFKVDDWNRDLSPWSAPPVFGKKTFGDGASNVLNEMLSHCRDKTKIYCIGGYSLSALFALWAAYQTDVFQGVAAASPSMWFQGFTDYMKTRKINCGKVYLSLGDAEDKTRHPVMSTVGEKIREGFEILSDENVETVLEWNEGNHFKDPDLRTAKAFSWLINKITL